MLSGSEEEEEERDGKEGGEGGGGSSSSSSSSSDGDAGWGSFGRRAPPPQPAAARGGGGGGAGRPPRAPAPPRGRRASRSRSRSSSADGFDPTVARPRHYKRGDAGREVAAMQRSFCSSGGGSAEASGSELSAGSGGGGAGGGGGGEGLGKPPPAAAAGAGAPAPAAGLVIAMVGHPNVGKSSVINALCGEKRVSVSRTAGHTKRAQTIPLATGVALLDCPGLVFPHALVPPPEERGGAREFGAGGGGSGGEAAAGGRPAAARSTAAVTLSGTDAEERAKQECCGVVPLAQVREPFTAVRFLGEHLEVERLYGLAPPRDELEDMVEAAGVPEGASRGAAMSDAAARYVWSPLSLCEQLAEKRGYYIAKTGRLDAHAAGREILYDAQDGVLPLWWQPPA